MEGWIEGSREQRWSVVRWYGSGYFCIFCQVADGWTHCGWGGCNPPLDSPHRCHRCSPDVEQYTSLQTSVVRTIFEEQELDAFLRTRLQHLLQHLLFFLCFFLIKQAQGSLPRLWHSRLVVTAVKPKLGAVAGVSGFWMSHHAQGPGS